MTTFLIPFFAFMAVILIMLLVYMVWAHFIAPGNKAKKQRLQALLNAVRWGGNTPPSISQNSLPDSVLEIWLRSRSGIFKQLEKLVQRANSPLTVRRLIGLMLALFTVVVLFGLLRQINPWLFLVPAAAIASTPVLWLSQRANRRSRAFENKFPETIDYISRAMRAGHSLTSAIGMVGKEFPDPIGQEFKTVSDEMAFGIPFKDAIGQLADRVKSNDVSFFVISLMIQHEAGGNLTELLDGLATTIRKRFKLRGKIRTLSAEGRLSAWLLGGMPFALTGIIMILNPGYISELWTSPLGQKFILIGSGLMAAGIFVLSRIIQIKV